MDFRGLLSGVAADLPGGKSQSWYGEGPEEPAAPSQKRRSPALGIE